MRLLGARPWQVSVVSAVESTVAAIAGTAMGFGLFFAFRGPAAGINLTGATFFPGSDVVLLCMYWHRYVLLIGIIGFSAADILLQHFVRIIMKEYMIRILSVQSRIFLFSATR